MIKEKFLACMLHDVLTMEALIDIDEEGQGIIDEEYLPSYFILRDLIEMLDAGDIQLEFISDKAGKTASFHKLLSDYACEMGVVYANEQETEEQEIL